MMAYPWETVQPNLGVWALEPYCGGSHKYFLRGLALASRHDFRLFTLPGRHWKWRMQGGALALAAQACAAIGTAGHPEHGSDTGAAVSRTMPRYPDVFFASDMLDLPTFRALVHSSLARVPTLVYFHENQFTYPLPPGVERDLGYGMRNLLSAACAQRVLFNSEHHRREFMAAATNLLSLLPDEVPPGMMEAVERRSGVLAVGCDLRRFDEHRDRGRAEAAAGRWGDPAAGPLVLWNQRWEYDKAPERLFDGLRELHRRGVPFRLAVVGASPSAPTEVFSGARADLADRVVAWGQLDRWREYASLLWAADVVVSTAIHEFFGVAVVEAVYCGCRPVLPWRLSYPELIPAAMHEEVLYREGDFVSALERALVDPHAWSEEWQRSWMARFDWAALVERYDEEIRRCRRMGIFEQEGSGGYWDGHVPLSE